MSKKEKLLHRTLPATLLGDGEFVLHYQPQYRTIDQTISGFEALIRWKHPTSGILSAQRFIPSLEKNGGISAVGVWALQSACEQSIAWQEVGLGEVTVAVNVAQEQLLDPSFAKTVRYVLGDLDLPAHRLELEITESAPLCGKQVEMTLASLSDLGVGIALDDFGTGYSALSVLGQNPFSRVKIAKELTKHIANPRYAEIIESVIALCRKIGCRVTVEGIETEQQHKYFIGLDVEAQGYFLGRPANPEAISEILLGQQHALSFGVGQRTIHSSLITRPAASAGKHMAHLYNKISASTGQTF